jgi:hypothetical protein
VFIRGYILRLPHISVLLLCYLAGCYQGNSFGTIPVTGKVTYKGQGVEGATISFMPEGQGRPATAISTAGGAYELSTLDSKGAIPGPYTVVVRKTEIPLASTAPVSMEDALKLNNKPPPPPKELLPAKYADAAKSPLKFEVKKGQTNTFDLPLAD